jgi:hypothetical protein
MHDRIGSIFLLIALVFSTGAFAYEEQNSIYDSIKLVLYHYDNNPCSIPGAIQVSNDSCKHPLFKYTTYNGLSDTLIHSSDSTQTRPMKARTTLLAFLRFSEIPSSSPKLSNLKHDQFLKLVEVKNEVRKMPWIIKKLFAVWYFVVKVIEKIFNVVINPVMKLSTLWKAVLVIIITLMATCIVIIVSRFSARFYPSTFDNKDNAKLLHDVKDSNWLSCAQSHLNQKMYTECISDIYRWFLQSIDSRKMVRRYEWWTNRQLLELIRVRNKNHYPLAGRIIGLYEQTIYGHRVPESEIVEQLMQSVINDRGFRS